MLPAFEKIEVNIHHSFYVNHMKVDYFPSPLHFHPEVEILLILHGTGTCFVGNSVRRYSPGELVMIGKNVPHVWYSDKEAVKINNRKISEAIYIQFNKEIFGEQFWQLPESRSIDKLINLSQMGLKLNGMTRDKVSALMMKITESSGFKRVTLLLSILETISCGEEYNFLTTPVEKNDINQQDSDRLNKVYEYVVENFYTTITLEKAASLASLSVSAFCRYFKIRTHKTFVQFLNEIRIAQACRLLMDENRSVAEVCYISGFNNISYFIRQFKKITGFTPLNYKKKYLK